MVLEAKPEATPTMLDEVKAEQAKLKEAPAPKTEPPTEEKPKVDEEKEPEFTDPAMKNQRAWNLKQAEKLATEKQTLADEKAALEAQRAEFATEKAEIEKLKATTAKSETEKTDEITLAHWKDITDDQLKDDEGDAYKDSLLLRESDRALAKEILGIRAELAALKSDNEKLKAEALPDEFGMTGADRMRLAVHAQSQGEAAAAAIKEEYGIEVDPVNILGATNEFATGFIELGEFRARDALESDAMVRCWKHANRNELAGLVAKAKEGEPATNGKPKLPPLAQGGGKGKEPPNADSLSPSQQMLADVRAEEARLAKLR